MSDPRQRQWHFYLDDMHAYLGIDDDTIWSIIQDDLPALLRSLQAIRSSVQS